jgi:hypothetical protein
MQLLYTLPRTTGLGDWKGILKLRKNRKMGCNIRRVQDKEWDLLGWLIGRGIKEKGMRVIWCGSNTINHTGLSVCKKKHENVQLPCFNYVSLVR